MAATPFFTPQRAFPFNEELIARVQARRAAIAGEEGEDEFELGGSPPRAERVETIRTYTPETREYSPFPPVPPVRRERLDFEVHPQKFSDVVFSEGLPPAQKSTFEFIQPELAQRMTYSYRQELPATSQASMSRLKRPRSGVVHFDHPAAVDVTLDGGTMSRTSTIRRTRARKPARTSRAVKTSVSRTMPPVVIKTGLHPLVSRIKYQLERKVLGLASRIQKVRNTKGTMKYTNRDGSTRMQAIKLPGGGTTVIPLRAAQERALMGKLGSVIADAQGLGFAKYLIEKIDIPPAQYNPNRANRLEQFGTRLLQMNPSAL